jgi:hypothetical protein
LLAPLAGRIYDHAPQQNAFPLGIEGEFMSAFGYWASIIGGLVVLAGALAARRSAAPNNLIGFWNAMSLLGLGMIVGPFPWATGVRSETTRITASVGSIMLSLSAIALLIRWRLVSLPRHDA